jgi:hypothetical protein
VSSFASDDGRYAAWQVHEGGPLVVLDTLTGRQRTMTLPTGCNLGGLFGGLSFGTGAGGRFLLECNAAVPARTAVFNVRTGRSFLLPADGIVWSRLGTRYAQGFFEEGEKPPQVIDDLVTGKLRRVSEEEAVLDLDRAGAPGMRETCPSLLPRVRKEQGLAGLGSGFFGYGNGAFVSEYGQHGEVQIDRCDGRSTVLKGQFVTGSTLEINHRPRDFDVGAALASWDTGSVSPSPEFPEEPRERSFRPTVTVYTLASGARRHWTLPRARIEGAPAEEEMVRGSFGYSTHTAHMVFWIATRTDSCNEGGCDPATAAVYGARL